MVKLRDRFQFVLLFLLVIFASLACVTVTAPISALIPTASPAPAAVSATAKANVARTALAATATTRVEIKRTAQAAKATPVSQSQLAQTATAIHPTLVARQQWPLVISDTFVGEVNGWYTGTSKTDVSNSEWTFVDGKYQWKEQALQTDFNYTVEQIFYNQDFYLSVDAEKVDGSPDVLYGLVMRQNDVGRFYFFAISNRQYYGLLAFDGEWRQIIDWTDSSAIAAQGVNELAVTADGPMFWLYVNGQYIDSIYDDSIPDAGFFGVGLMLDEGNDVTLEFDNFIMRRKP